MQRKRRLAFKQPEIKKCLESVNLLLQRREEGEPVRLDGRHAKGCDRWQARHCAPAVSRVTIGCPCQAPQPWRFCLLSCRAMYVTRWPVPTTICCILPLPPPPRPWNQAVLDFSLSDQVFARARVADVTSVNLWLGADVMLEYTLEDAQVGGCVAQSKPLLLSGGCGGLGAPGWARS